MKVKWNVQRNMMLRKPQCIFGWVHVTFPSDVMERWMYSDALVRAPQERSEEVWYHHYEATTAGTNLYIERLSSLEQDA